MKCKVVMQWFIIYWKLSFVINRVIIIIIIIIVVINNINTVIIVVLICSGECRGWSHFFEEEFKKVLRAIQARIHDNG